MRGPREAQSVLLPVRWFLTITTVSLTALAGYGGFRWAARLDLGGEAGAGMVALAAVTGFAVVFSPCSFPLLVGVLARSDPDAVNRHHRRDGLASALAIGAGAAVFLLAAGAAVGLIGEGVAELVGFSTIGGRILRVGVAGVLVASGLVQLGILRVPLWRIARLAGPLDRRRVAISHRRRRGGQMLYGFAFVLAGFGWTGPLFAGLASHAATAGGLTSGVVVFGVAAAMLVATLAGLALTLATLNDHLLEEVRTHGPHVKRVGGALLIGIGSWFIYLAAANPTYLLS